MFRTAYTEDFMATLAHQSMAIWDELEEEAGEPLRMMSGLLNFGDPNYGVRLSPTLLTLMVLIFLAGWRSRGHAAWPYPES